MARREPTRFQAATTTALIIATYLLGAWGIDAVGTIWTRRDQIQHSTEASCDGCGEGEQKDLYAQVRMAEAAEALVDLSLAQLVFSVFGVGLIGWTLLYTADATKAAIRAARAAERSTRAAQANARRELRAYLVAELQYLSRVEIGKPIRASVRIVNSGQTPAYCVRGSAYVRYFDYGEPVPVPPPRMDIDPRNSRVVGPGRDMFMYCEADEELTAEMLGQVHSGKAGLFLAGLVEYRDAFGDNQYVTFIHTYRGSELEPRYNETGNDAS